MKNKLNYAAKILAILYILFISIFAFDTPFFSIEFLIHLLPSLIFIWILIFAWSRSRIGGILFGILGIATIFFFDTYKDLIVFFLISLIPIVNGILFWLSDKH